MSAVREAVQREIAKMSETQLKEVLAAIRGQSRPLGPGMPGRAFIERFGGLIPPDELDRMEAAIERDCETIEHDSDE